MTTAAKPETKTPAPAAKTATAPAKKSKVPLTEAQKAEREKQRAAKFRELGNRRLGNALKRMKHLENLGRGQYVYTAEQADTIIRKLTDGVAAVKIAFAPKSRGSAAAQDIEYL